MYEAANDPVYEAVPDNTPEQFASLSREATAQTTVADLYRAYGGSPIPKQHGTAATRGHCAGNGGLRGHSVGGVFPCVIFAHGKPDSLRWGFHTPTNEQFCDFPSYDDAYLAAGIWLDNRPVSFQPQVDV